MKETNNLKGYDAINRAKQLMSESIEPKTTNDRKGFSLVKKGVDGNTYAIVKENSKYFLKKAEGVNALVHSDFKYLMGDSRKSSVMFESFSKATNKLNNILIGLNEMNDSKCSNSNLLTSDVEVTNEEIVSLGDDIELQEEEAEYAFNLDEMISEENPLDEMENECMSKLDEMSDFLEDSINEKFTLKLDSPKSEETPELDLDSMADDANSNIEDIGDEMADDGMESDSEDNPFEDEPFDAGVEANEDEDPEKFLQQLSGKLATSLRQYSKENEGDVDTQKFVANTVLSAVDTNGMEQSDINDIKGKLDSNKNDTDDEEISDNDDEPELDNTEDFSDDEETDNEEELTEEEVNNFNNAWDSFHKGVNEDLSDDEHEKIMAGLRNSSPKPSSRPKKEYKEKEGAKELSRKRKNMDPDKPLTDPVNKLNENYNKNLDEYLCSLVNSSIFVNDEKKNEMTEQPVVKPEVRPTTAPTETPSRRQAPFKRPGTNPQVQPKFKK